MRAVFLVTMHGGELRAGEIEQIRHQLQQAADHIEPLMDNSVQVFYTVPGRAVADGQYVTESD